MYSNMGTFVFKKIFFFKLLRLQIMNNYILLNCTEKCTLDKYVSSTITVSTAIEQHIKHDA